VTDFFFLIWTKCVLPWRILIKKISHIKFDENPFSWKRRGKRQRAEGYDDANRSLFWGSCERAYQRDLFTIVVLCNVELNVKLSVANARRSSRNRLVFLSNINRIWFSSTDFLKKSPVSNLTKICPVETELDRQTLRHTEERTDGEDNASRCFSLLYHPPKTTVRPVTWAHDHYSSSIHFSQ
jgi:hypothetical protein